MALTRLKLSKFTAFSQLQVELSPGINVFIGKNGTGKTHLLKVLYSVCKITEGKQDLSEKLVRVFMPYEDRIGRLVHRRRGVDWAKIEASRDDRRLTFEFSSRASDAPKIRNLQAWLSRKIVASYIPPKEFLSHAAGFRSLYERREVAFEEVYDDLLAQAYLPPLREQDDRRTKVLEILRKAIEGKVILKGDEFFLKNRQGNLEFPLLAEGMRKLGLIWVLVQNGTLLGGSVLLWDEPEANLNPSLMPLLVEVLLELQRSGVQIILATHDYVVLKALDLKMRSDDQVAYHSLFRDAESGEISAATAAAYTDIHPNAILETFSDLFDQEVVRSLAVDEVSG